MAQTITLKDTNTEDLIKILELHVQSGNLNFLFGSGSSMPAIKLAGDIESSINTLLKDGKSSDADQTALTFLNELDDVNNKVIKAVADPAITETLEGYKDFLLTLDNLMFERKNVLLPRQANIFTTNYDFFFERAASELATVYLNDGFDRTSANTAGFPFMPERFSDRVFRSGKVFERHAEVPSVNLIKLHGSLTWRRTDDTAVHFSTDPVTKLTDGEMKDETSVREHLSQRAVILPNMRKFESTLLERVYFDLLRLYSNALDKENALLVVFGFSFADEHILDITKRALRNPTAKIIIFSYSSGTAANFADKFSQQRNVLIIAPDGTETFPFSKLNSLLKEIATSPIDKL